MCFVLCGSFYFSLSEYKDTKGNYEEVECSIRMKCRYVLVGLRSSSMHLYVVYFYSSTE